MNLAKTEDPNFSRDVDSQLVINTNNDGYLAYLREREQYLTMKAAVTEVNSLKQQLDELKSLVHHLMSNNK